MNKYSVTDPVETVRRIKEIRKEKKLLYTHIAMRTGIRGDYIYAWEHLGRIPQLSEVRAVAKTLDVNYKYLLAWKGVGKDD